MLDWSESQIGDDGQVLVFQLTGHLDSLQADYLYTVLQKRIRDGQTRLLLDCQGLESISSMGLGMLIRANGRVAGQGGQVRLARVPGLIAEVLRTTRLDQVLNVYGTVEDAVVGWER